VDIINATIASNCAITQAPPVGEVFHCLPIPTLLKTAKAFGLHENLLGLL
jgi:hypothetical protein